jgi:hypothetical protein
MNGDEFRDWLGKVPGMNETERRQLTTSRLAERFLIVWHLFEVMCFDRNCTQRNLRDRSKRYAPALNLELDQDFLHFHARYQDAEKLRHLLNEPESKTVGHTRGDVTSILRIKAEDVPDEDRVYLLIAVVNRYRNNMFHGNKGLHSWLNYKEQIERCIRCMQRFVEVECLRPGK